MIGVLVSYFVNFKFKKILILCVFNFISVDYISISDPCTCVWRIQSAIYVDMCTGWPLNRGTCAVKSRRSCVHRVRRLLQGQGVGLRSRARTRRCPNGRDVACYCQRIQAHNRSSSMCLTQGGHFLPVDEGLSCIARRHHARSERPLRSPRVRADEGGAGPGPRPVMHCFRFCTISRRC